MGSSPTFASVDAECICWEESKNISRVPEQREQMITWSQVAVTSALDLDSRVEALTSAQGREFEERRKRMDLKLEKHFLEKQKKYQTASFLQVKKEQLECFFLISGFLFTPSRWLHLVFSACTCASVAFHF